MTIHFDIPSDVENALRQLGSDPNQVLKEAALIELYRRGRLTHHQLSNALGLNKLQTDARLKSLGVYEGSLDAADLEADRRALDRILKATG